MSDLRLCLGCLDDWATIDQPFCTCCQLEHDRATRAIAKGTARQRRAAAWNGATLGQLDEEGNGVAIEDIVSGFHVEVVA